MNCEYAIVPDQERRIAAVFADLGEAIDWATARFGEDRFTIRHCPVLEVARAEAQGAAGPV